MSGSAYSYLDLTVLDGVRQHLLSDRAALLFTDGLSEILWCNAEGLALTGAGDVREAIDGSANLTATMRRQIGSALAKLGAGDGPVNAIIRVQRGFRSSLVTFTLQAVALPDGERGLLLLSESLSGSSSAEPAQAGAMTARLDGRGHSSAILAEHGAVVAGSPSFAALNINEADLRAICDAATADDSRIVKRILDTGRGAIPVGLAKISDAPDRFLLIAARAEETNGDEVEGSLLPEGPQPADDAPATAAAPTLSRWYYNAAPPREGPHEENVVADDAIAPDALPDGEVAHDDTEAPVKDAGPVSYLKKAVIAGAVATGAVVAAAVGASRKDDAAGEPDDVANAGDDNGINADTAADAAVGQHDRETGGDGKTNENDAEDTGGSREASVPATEDAMPVTPEDELLEHGLADERFEVIEEPAEILPAPFEDMDTPPPRPRSATPPRPYRVEIIEPLDIDFDEMQELFGNPQIRPREPLVAEPAQTEDAAELETVVSETTEPGQPETDEADASHDTFDLPPYRYAPSADPVRFAWETDADKKIVTVGLELLGTLGADPAEMIGKTWRHAADAMGISETAPIDDLLDGHDTWSDRTIHWPTADGQALVPVDMSGLPAFDRDRQFKGYKGFGIIRMADAEADTGGLLPVDGAENNGAEAERPAEALMVEDQATDAAFDDETIEDDAAADGMSFENPAAIAPVPLAAFADEAMEQDVDNARQLSPRDREVFDEIGNRLSDESDTSAEPEAADIEATETPTTNTPTEDEEPADTDQPVWAAADAQGTDAQDSDEQDRDAQDSDAQDGDAQDGDEQDGVVHAPSDADQAPEETPEDSSETTATDEQAWNESEHDPDTAQHSEPDEVTDGTSDGNEPSSREPEAINDTDLVSDDTHDGPNLQVVEPSLLYAATPDGVDGDTSADEEAWSAAEAEAAGTDTKAEDTLGPQHDDAAGDCHEADDAATAPEVAPPDRPVVPKHDVDTSILARLPIPLLVYRDYELLFANADFYNLTGYQSLDDFAEAGGVERLFGANDDQHRSGPGAPIYHRNGELLDVQAHLQHVPWDAARAMLLTLRPGGGRDGRGRQSPDLPNDGGNIVSFTASPRHGSDGPTGSFGGVSADDLRAVLDTASDGILFLSADGAIRGASRSAEALLDRSAAEMDGHNLADYLAQESRAKLADYLLGISGGGVERLLNDGREVMVHTPDGGLIPVFMTIGRMSESDKLCAVMRDVTAWRRTEEELLKAKSQAETASEQKTGFLARISHEIRTPLNAIIGFSDLMIEERFGRIENDRYRGYLHDIHRSGTHVLDLVNDLLDISKIEAGKLELSFDACDLNFLVSNCVATMQAQANTHRIIIRTSLSAVVPKVVADQRSIKQIVLNLVSNSIKFTRAGGQVIVSTVYDQSGEVALRVRDTGIGMSADDLEQALQPFQQVETVPNRMPPRHNEQKGTGLGLPLTRAIVEANKARFSIESELEEGTLVEIRFPANRVLVDAE